MLQASPSPTILIVEDEPKLARLLQDYLTQAGYVVDCVAHGFEVVPWVQQRAPALILLDLMLPGKDGMAVCRELRAFSAVPIIMVTAIDCAGWLLLPVHGSPWRAGSLMHCPRATLRDA